MVLVTLEHAPRTVQDHFPIFRAVAGNRIGQRIDPFLDGIPNPMRFQIGLVNEIEAVFVAQAVEMSRIRIMAGPDSIDIIALHREYVPPRHFLRHNPAAAAVKLMPVHALEHDPLSVEMHDVIDQLKAPEADFLRHSLSPFSVRPVYFKDEPVEIRILGAPFSRIFY